MYKSSIYNFFITLLMNKNVMGIMGGRMKKVAVGNLVSDVITPCAGPDRNDRESKSKRIEFARSKHLTIQSRKFAFFKFSLLLL